MSAEPLALSHGEEAAFKAFVSSAEVGDVAVVFTPPGDCWILTRTDIGVHVRASTEAEAALALTPEKGGPS